MLNQDGTVTLAFYDSNGFNYQPYAEVVFSATNSNPATDPNACRIRYDRGTGSSNHVLGLYSGDFSAAGLWGAAPVGQAGAIVQRNQNCILDIGRSYVVQESGTGASVNLALTFPTTGTNYFWMESFDRQATGGAVQTGSLYIPPNSFTLMTSASMSQPFAVQAGSSGSFTLNAPATGTFSGNVALSYAAPTGVSVTFQANPVASPGSTTFTVAASASAAVGNGTITITGMGGGITSVVSVPFMVTAAGGGTTTYSAPATFALSGSQTLNVSVTPPITGPIATFVVTATGFNGFSAGQLIGLSTDSNVKTASLSYSPLASVYAGQSVTVGLTPLGQGTPVAGGLQYCGVIDATSTGYSNSSVTLCAVINGATQSTSVAFPQPSTGYAVPVRGSIMVQAAVSQFGSSTPVSFTQSVKCPGVSNCTAGASLVSSSNGNLTIQFNAGNVPGGLSYTQQFVINNEEIDVPVYCDPGGGVVAPTIIPATSYSSGSNVVTLATDNDGSTNSANYTMSCGTYSPCGFGSMGTCVAQGAGSHVTLFQRAYGAAGATSFGFSLSATADDQATAGFYQIACSYLGSAPIAGSLAVYDATPVITSVSPGTVPPGAQSITVTGRNFGNNPTVTVGAASQSFPGTGISGQVSLTGTYQIPASAAGTTLPVTLTAAGESGNGFLQNPQNNGASHPGSGMASVNVGCQNATVSINDSNQSIPGRKFTFNQVSGTGVFANGSYTPNSFLTALSATASTSGGSYVWSVDNTSMVQFSTASGGTGPTSTGQSTYLRATEQTDSQVSANSLGRAATVTVTYTGQCGVQTAYFTFVLTEDVTAIAYVDYQKTLTDVSTPASPSYFNFHDSVLLNDAPYQLLASNLSAPVSCAVDVGAWSAAALTGLPIGRLVGSDSIVEEPQRRYANYFLTAGTANTFPGGNNAPPSQIDAAALFSSPQYYRIYNRFEAAYQITGRSSGSILPVTLQPLHSQTDAGLTLEPCSGYQINFSSPKGERHVGFDPIFGVSPDGKLAYQQNEGRVGTVGQAGNAYVNKRPGFGSSLAPQYTNYSQVTPYVWSVIQFDNNGTLQPLIAGSEANLLQSRGYNASVYSTFVVYKDGQRADTVTLQGDIESFITLDSSYRHLGIQ